MNKRLKLFIGRYAGFLMPALLAYRDKKESDSYVESIKKSYSELTDKKVLSSEQEKEIQDFFKNLLGHKIPLDYHKYFTSRTGNYSKLYFPTSEYKTNIIGRLNIYPLKRAYTDKNVTDLILPNIHQPKIYMKNMNGYYYVAGKPVSMHEATSFCANLGDVIIKPSLTARGKGVAKISIKNGFVDGAKSLESVFTEYNKDFLIEELIHQHKDLAALNPSSTNTLRFVTYRNGMDVLVVYSVIRIGRAGKPIDNESAGGISTIINNDGTLGKYAYGAPGQDKIEYTDSGVKLEGYNVPSYDKATDFVKRAHMLMPYFNLLAWDVAIEEDGQPILIEFNMTPDLSQSANGPAFGEYTEMIIKDAMNHPNTFSQMSKECMWK